MSTTPVAADSVVRDCVAGQRSAFLQELAELLRIPSVSADCGHAGPLRRGAEWPWTGTPGPDVPTVLIHGRHDVRPAAREAGRPRAVRSVPAVAPDTSPTPGR